MESLLFWFHLGVLAWMGGEKGGGETMGGGGGGNTYSFGKLSLLGGGGEEGGEFGELRGPPCMAIHCRWEHSLF